MTTGNTIYRITSAGSLKSKGVFLSGCGTPSGICTGLMSKVISIAFIP